MSEFDADQVVVGGWFDSLINTVKDAAGTAQAFVKTSEGTATLDALKKAGSMISKARAGNPEAKAKVANVVAKADQGDPAAKLGEALLKMANDLIKKQAAKGTAENAAVGHERAMNADLDVDTGVEMYDWGW